MANLGEMMSDHDEVVSAPAQASSTVAAILSCELCGASSKAPRVREREGEIVTYLHKHKGPGRKFQMKPLKGKTIQENLQICSPASWNQNRKGGLSAKTRIEVDMLKHLGVLQAVDIGSSEV